MARKRPQLQLEVALRLIDILVLSLRVRRGYRDCFLLRPLSLLSASPRPLPLSSSQLLLLPSAVSAACRVHVTAPTAVRTTSTVRAFAWDFHLLRAYLKTHPMEGNAMQVSISADLTRKLDQSRDPHLR